MMYLFTITVCKFSLLVPETATDGCCQIRKRVRMSFGPTQFSITVFL